MAKTNAKVMPLVLHNEGALVVKNRVEPKGQEDFIPWKRGVSL
jgi:hypothetical protein